MSIGPPSGNEWSQLSRPGSQPTTSAWTFPCCADKPWCLACGCERCIADKREHLGAASAVPRAAPRKAEPLPTVVLSATASSVPRPAPPEPEPLPSVASVPPPRWPPPPKELPPSVPQPASPEVQLLPAGKPDGGVWPRGSPTSYCPGPPWCSPCSDGSSTAAYVAFAGAEATATILHPYVGSSAPGGVALLARG